MRITTVEIKDFRGFPGPGTYTFDLDGGKNLLIYGENGSGKSSLFRALVEFFNLNPRAKPFADYKNIFSDPDLTDGYIGVHFRRWRIALCVVVQWSPAYGRNPCG